MSSSAGDQTPQVQTPVVGFPWNRVAALLGPFIAIVSGAVAAWLLRHFPGIHIDQTTLGTTISEALVFAVAAAGTFAIHHKWLSGWQQYEQSVNEARAAAAVMIPEIPPPAGSSGGNSQSAQSVPGNGQPTNGASAGLGANLEGLIDTVLPTWMEELVSTPATTVDASSESRPDTAVTPDEPVNELQEPAGV